ncbi:MAG: DHA2 family efflux MFS transporter permease subunit [Dermatophilaceae bacterium]
MTSAPAPHDITTGTTAEPVNPRRWFALGILAAGLAMIVLDGTIVGVALPRIIADLGLDLTDAQWVNSLYSMIFAALLLTFGRVADRWGRRRVFVAGVVVFVAGSVIAGLADSASTLIAARALQGVGGAMILPTTLSTVNATFRGEDRAAAFGVWGAVMAGAAAIGPLLGGWLTTSFDWRWIFYVNVPIGVLILAGTAYAVTETRGAPGGPGVDVDGLLTSGIGLSLFVFALIEGRSLGWWQPAADFSVFGLTWPRSAPISIVPVAFAVAALFLALFILWERHRAHNGRDALLDLTLFRVPTFTWGNLTALTVAAGEFALVFLLPLYLVNVLGLDIMGAGFVLAAMAIGAFVSGASARHLAARMSPSAVVVVGLSLELAGVAATALLLGPTTSPWLIALPMAVYGVGLGLASAQLTSLVLGDIPAAQSGSASATQSTLRQIGSALGSAVAGTALAAALTDHLPGDLAAVRGLPSQVASQLASGTVDSAGGLIASLRDQGTTGRLGPLGPAATDALAAGFASATRSAVIVAALFLALGLLGALRVRAATRTR